MRCNGGTIGAAVTALLLLTSPARAEFSFRAIEGLDADVIRISGDGTTVVGEAANAPAFWTEATGVVPLGDLPGGAETGSAFGVSVDGAAIVGSAGSASGVEAFRWTADEGMVGLGDLAGSEPFASHALAVSADGSVVVGMSSRSWPLLRAFRWTEPTGVVDLNGVAGGDGLSSAQAITPDGSIIVGARRTTTSEEAFRWSEATGLVPLGFVPGAFASRALAVSADGAVVVGIGSGPSGFEAFRWTAASGMVGLGSLDPSDFASSASAVSADGRVVAGIGSGAADFNGEAFVWFPGTGMLDLREYLVANGVASVAGWRLIDASGISLDGRTLVGIGRNPAGQGRAWIARIEIDETPPPAPTPSPTPTPGPGEPETIAPTGSSVLSGTQIDGGLARILASDDTYLEIQGEGVKKIQVAFTGRALRADVRELRFAMESAASAPRTRREIALFDWVRDRWVTIDRGTASAIDEVVEVRTANRASRFVEAGTRRVQARVTFTSRRSAAQEVRVDRVSWTRVP
jgi:probable HAF family extracellular repeat protein